MSDKIARQARTILELLDKIKELEKETDKKRKLAMWATSARAVLLPGHPGTDHQPGSLPGGNEKTGKYYFCEFLAHNRDDQLGET